jgi:hypothetical protein
VQFIEVCVLGPHLRQTHRIGHYRNGFGRTMSHFLAVVEVTGSNPVRLPWPLADELRSNEVSEPEGLVRAVESDA